MAVSIVHRNAYTHFNPHSTQRSIVSRRAILLPFRRGASSLGPHDFWREHHAQQITCASDLYRRVDNRLGWLGHVSLGRNRQRRAAIEGTRILRIANLAGANLGTAPTTLSYPAAIRVAGNGDNFILDCGNGRVAVTASNGTAKASFSLATPAKTQWEAITDLALDKAGNVYLTNAVANSVEKYSATGQKLATFATGEVKGPQGLAVTSNGEIIVSDTMNHAVAIFDAEGKLLKKIGQQGEGNGQFQYPRGVAVDSQGNIYVADSLNAKSKYSTPKVISSGSGALRATKQVNSKCPPLWQLTRQTSGCRIPNSIASRGLISMARNRKYLHFRLVHKRMRLIIRRVST